MQYTGTSASCHVYCIKHEDLSCYMCFISRRPRTYRVIIINRKELYDFYYTAITLTTGYKNYCNLALSVSVHVSSLCQVKSSTPILLCSVTGYDASGRVDDLATQQSKQCTSIAIGECSHTLTHSTPHPLPPLPHTHTPHPTHSLHTHTLHSTPHTPHTQDLRRALAWQRRPSTVPLRLVAGSSLRTFILPLSG